MRLANLAEKLREPGPPRPRPDRLDIAAAVVLVAFGCSIGLAVVFGPDEPQRKPPAHIEGVNP